MAETTWLEDVSIEEKYPHLKEDASADVVVVGAGLAGTLTAYFLSKEGKRVILLDKGTLESSMTAYTTAFITYIIDTELTDLISMFGEEKAKGVWESSNEAIDLIEKIVREENIDCEFERTSEYMFALSSKETDELEKEYESSKKVGFKELRLHDKNILPFKNEGCLEIQNQAKFHPIKFILGLREKFIKGQVDIFEKSEVVEIKEREGSIYVKTKVASVQAGDVVICTYSPFNNPPELFAHKGMYTSYIFELAIPKGVLRNGLYLDLKNPYHYFRVDPKDSYDRFILGGEDHRKELKLAPEKSFSALIEYFKNLFPDIKFEVKKKWSGGVLEPIDGLPYIGIFSKAHPHQFVATAFSGNGMQYSAVSAKIICDLILGRFNPYAHIYDAGRKTSLKAFTKKGLDFGGEFFGGAGKNFFRKK